MDTERKTFDDGSWWEYRTFLSHAAKVATVAASRQFWKITEPAKLGDKGEVLAPPLYEMDWNIWYAEPANDAMLLYSTVDWSYGSVAQATLDEIPDEHSDYIVARMNELYAVPLVGAARNEPQSNSSAP